VRREVGSPAGPLRAFLPPPSISDAEPVMSPIPALGEHTDLILSELGYGEEDMAALRHTRAI
jgi:itaconate CoA-transferase